MRVVLKLAPHPPACRRAAQSQKAQEPGRQHLVPVVNDEEVAIEATIDGKVYTVDEGLIRTRLRFDDEGGSF